MSFFGDSLSGDNSMSAVARLGQQGQKWTDPLAWILGDKYTNALVKLADKSNKGFSEIAKPAVKVDKAINPLRQIPAYDQFASWTEAKPVDTAAIAAGAYFGGSALGNMGGTAGGPGGGSGGVGASGTQGFGGGGSQLAGQGGKDYARLIQALINQQTQPPATDSNAANGYGIGSSNQNGLMGYYGY